MADINRPDFLWKVIQRYDVYIGSTNAKAAFLIAWNTFLFGTIVVKGPEFCGQFLPIGWAESAVATMLVLLALAAMTSLWFTFRVVNPFLKSPKALMNYHSLIFFGHVCEFEDETKYYDAVAGITEESLIRDLSYQAHVLAKGLSGKFALLRLAIGTILFIQIPVFIIVILIFVVRRLLFP